MKLRALRLAAHKDVMDVTEAGLGSKAKISRIETGKGAVRVADIRALCWLYGADSDTTDALAALAPGTQADGWWEEYGDAVVPGWFGLYAGLEATASRIRCVEPETVHGLVQTPEYAASVIGADDPRVDAAVVASAVRFRMQRQSAVLDVDTPPLLVVVMTEGALRFGSPEVMGPQIEHLRTVAQRPNLDIRVLPFTAGTYPRRGSFALLDFDNDEDPSVAYVEVPGGARYFDRPPDRADYEAVFDLVLPKTIKIEEWNP